jgi:DNA processing protein
MSPDGERRARVALSFLAKPGDPVLGAALRSRTPTDVLALVTGADADGEVSLVGEAADGALHRAVQRWRDRLGEIPSTARLRRLAGSGLRLVLPGDAEWPTQLDDLSDTRLLVLWLQGTADLRLACVNSVAIVGCSARACSSRRSARSRVGRCIRSCRSSSGAPAFTRSTGRSGRDEAASSS